MLTKPIPFWVGAGAMALAALAGCINAVGFLGAHHQALSHLSGTVTNFGADMARGEWPLAAHAGLVLVFFFLGCVASGMIIRHSTLRAGRRYGVALCVESALLFGAHYFLRHDAFSGDYLAAMACGLQNAMATSYSGAVVRTTHMTGIVTDLGIAIGLTARGERADWRRMRLYLVLLAGFFCGGILGSLSYVRIGYDTLLYPATAAGLTGIGYTLFKQHSRRRSRTKVAPAHAVSKTQPSFSTSGPGGES
jgi:uncharacterized membrane protein YoaK (UPF0700 family)